MGGAASSSNSTNSRRVRYTDNTNILYENRFCRKGIGSQATDWDSQNLYDPYAPGSKCTNSIRLGEGGTGGYTWIPDWNSQWSITALSGGFDRNPDPVGANLVAGARNYWQVDCYPTRAGNPYYLLVPTPELTLGIVDKSGITTPSAPPIQNSEVKKISDNALPTNILTNRNWTPTVRMTDSLGVIGKIKEKFVTAKTTTMINKISLNGEIGTVARAEIEKSISYSIYFNFTNTSLVTRQINVSSSPPYNLYMSPNFKGREEFKMSFVNNTLGYQPDINRDAIANNAINCAVQVNSNFLKYIPYHTREYITSWAQTRYPRIREYEYAHFSTLSSIINTASTTVNDLSLWNGSFNGKVTLSDTESARKKIIEVLSTISSYSNITPVKTAIDSTKTAITNASTILIPIRCGYIDIQNSFKDYRDTMEECNNNNEYGYAAGNTQQVLDSIRAALSSLNATYNVYSTYHVFPPITATNPLGTNLSLIADPPQFDLFSMAPSSTQGYQVTTVNPMTFTLTFSSPIPETYAILPDRTITPETTQRITLPANLNMFNTPDGNSIDTTLEVSVTNIVNNERSFRANVVGYDKNSGILTVNKIKSITSDFARNITLSNSYIIQVANSSANTQVIGDTPSSATRNYMTSSEKRKLLNKIAQCYYENNPNNSPTNTVNNNSVIDTIYDTYQVGDTLFDVRFSIKTRDTAESIRIKGQINALRTNYEKYRLYNLTQTELLDLDSSYNEQLQVYNKALDEALVQTPSNCGPIARYIELKRIDAGFIQLCQIQVVGTDGTNMALNSNISVRQMPVPASSGSSGLTSSAKLFTEVGEDTTGRIWNSNATPAQNAQVSFATNEATKIGHINGLIDGVYTPRNIPNAYYSSGSTLDEFVKLDLGSDMEICSIILIFPYDVTPVTYNIKLTSSTAVQSASTGSALSRTDKTVQAIPNTAQNTATANCITKALPNSCPTTVTDKNKYARFYATITAPAGTVDMSKIEITGYSDGIDAAHTFNPKYNGGFVVQSGGSGNMNYRPEIIYINNPKPPALVSPTSNFCSDTDRLKNVIRDYITGLKNDEFTSRSDVTDSGIVYDTVKNNYYVSTIQSCTEILKATSSVTYGLKWTEVGVDNETNIQLSGFPRTLYGRFVYTVNTDNWYSNNLYYDIPKSKIYSTNDAYNTDNPGKPLTSLTEIQVPPILPTETYLDTLNKLCPQVDCSNPSVITQLVGQYNETPGITNKILRITKAATPNQNECHYNAFVDSTQTTLKMSVKTLPDCTLQLVNTMIGEGTNIQSNTPLLTQSYNYVNDVASTYVSAINSISTMFSNMISPQLDMTGSGLKAANTEYRTAGFGAYGQMKQLGDLDSCPIGALGTRCSDSAVVNEFMKNITASNVGTNTRITKLVGAGTYSASECDFTYETQDVSVVNGSFQYGSPRTVAKRVSMKPLTAATPCYYTVDTGKSTAPYTNGMQSINATPPTEDIENLYPPTVYRSTVPVTFDIGLGTSQYLSVIKLPPGTQQIVPIEQPTVEITVTNSTIVPQSYQTTGPITLDIPGGTSDYLPTIPLVAGLTISTNTVISITDSTNPGNTFYGIVDSYDSRGNLTVIRPSPANVVGTFGTPKVYNISVIPPSFTAIISASNYNPTTGELQIPRRSISAVTGTFITPATYKVSVIVITTLNTANTQSIPMKLAQTTVPANLPLGTTSYTFTTEPFVFKVGDTIIFKSGANSFTARVKNSVKNAATSEVTVASIMGTGSTTTATTTLEVENITPLAPLADLSAFRTAQIFLIYKYNPAQQLVNWRSPIEYIDCRSPYAIQQILTTLRNSPTAPLPTSVNIGNSAATDCAVQVGAINRTIKFARDPTNSLRKSLIPGTVEALNQVPSGLTTITNPSVTLTLGSVTSSQLATFFRSLGALPSPAPILVTNNTYEFRVNTNDYLPFGDTYNRAILYTDTQGALQVQDYLSSTPLTGGPQGQSKSPFTFFTTGTVQGNQILLNSTSVAEYITAFRDGWNRKYSTATPNQPKKKIGKIVGVNYEAESDGLIVDAEAADFGVNGDTDILNYYPLTSTTTTRFISTKPTDPITSSTVTIGPRRFRVVFRKFYAAPQTYFPFSMEEDPTVGALTPITFTDTWTDPDITVPTAATATTATVPTYKIQDPIVAMDNNYFVYMRFIITAAQTKTGSTSSGFTMTKTNGSTQQLNTEISNISFYQNKPEITSTNNAGTDFIYAAIPSNTLYTIDDISGGYQNSDINTPCRPGYKYAADPTFTSANLCLVDNPASYPFSGTYTDDSGKQYPTVCGIGYELQGSKCVANGNIASIGNRLSQPNALTPRLKMYTGQNLTINFGSKTVVDAFTFFTGFSDYLPVKWTLYGSMNGKLWKKLYVQDVNYNYNPLTNEIPTSSGNVRVPILSKTTNSTAANPKYIYSYISPAVFNFFKTTAPQREVPYFVTSTATTGATGTTSASLKMYYANGMNTLGKNYDNDLNGSITLESFVNSPSKESILHKPVNLPVKPRETPSNFQATYDMPLKQAPIPQTIYTQVDGPNRIQYLRFRVLKTVDPVSKFVHMSMLRLLTPMGPLGPAYITISNPMSVRKSGKEGPQALLEGGGRWVDYTKSPLILRFNSLPPTPIQGYQFSIPTGVPNPVQALPGHWIVEGSYDGRQWKIYDERIESTFYGQVSPVYKFAKEI